MKLNVDLIVAPATSAALAARDATSLIAIVPLRKFIYVGADLPTKTGMFTP
jgi:hypothetical protein